MAYKGGVTGTQGHPLATPLAKVILVIWNALKWPLLLWRGGCCRDVKNKRECTDCPLGPKKWPLKRSSLSGEVQAISGGLTVLINLYIYYLSNRPQLSMGYRLINHVGCWQNMRRICKFTNSLSVLPTSQVVYQPINHRKLWSIAFI